ncbi:hypothetical protein ES703_32364 [subsurface metagenome]
MGTSRQAGQQAGGSGYRLKMGARNRPSFVNGILKRGSNLAVSSSGQRHDRVSTPLVVRLYPRLSAAALKAGLDKELALWYELRAINANGSSRLLLNDTLATLVGHFGYTQSTAYRLLSDGDGKLWQIRPSPGTLVPVIKIQGLLRVAEYLDTPGVGRPVEVKVSDFSGSRAKKTAWLYASFFKPNGPRAKPISRASLEVATGVKRRQQQRYDKVAGIKRVANFAFRQDGKGNLVPIFHLVSGKCKQWLKQRRLGNSYSSKALKAPRGMTKRVNAELRHRSLYQDEASCVPKRFFLSARSLLRSPERHKEAFILANKRDRVIPGRLEWCMA